MRPTARCTSIMWRRTGASWAATIPGAARATWRPKTSQGADILSAVCCPMKEREEADATFPEQPEGCADRVRHPHGPKSLGGLLRRLRSASGCPPMKGKDGTLVPVIRLTVTRRAAAQEGQGDPHRGEADRGRGLHRQVDPGCRNRKVDLSDLGCGRSGCRRARHLCGRARRTGPPARRGDNAAHRNAPGGGKPARRSSHGRRGYTESGTSGRWGKKTRTRTPRRGDGDGQSAPQEETLSAASLHSDPADGEHGGAGSGPATPTEPAEDPDQIGDPDSQVPSEETPPAAQPQTELEKVGPQRRPVGVHREGRAELRSEGSVV